MGRELITVFDGHSLVGKGIDGDLTQPMELVGPRGIDRLESENLSPYLKTTV